MATLAPQPVRPKFNSHITSDRLREGAGLRLPPFAVRSSNIQKGRTSVFREALEDDVGAFGDAEYLVVPNDPPPTPKSSAVDVLPKQGGRPWYAKLAAKPAQKRHASLPTVTVSTTDA